VVLDKSYLLGVNEQQYGIGGCFVENNINAVRQPLFKIKVYWADSKTLNFKWKREEIEWVRETCWGKSLRLFTKPSVRMSGMLILSGLSLPF
jgi:hypothetical protein